jgi:hypothetical protein
VIDARSEAWLRTAYGRWLAERGVRLFGEPLDHGDELGAPGFEAGGRSRPRPRSVRAAEPKGEARWTASMALPDLALSL